MADGGLRTARSSTSGRRRLAIRRPNSPPPPCSAPSPNSKSGWPPPAATLARPWLGRGRRVACRVRPRRRPRARRSVAPVLPGDPAVEDPRPIVSHARMLWSSRSPTPPARSRRWTPLASAPDPAVRAGALLRQARIARKMGRTERALAAFDSLIALDATRVGGWPAGLAGRQGRALLLESLERRDESRARRETPARRAPGRPLAADAGAVRVQLVSGPRLARRFALLGAAR